MALQDARVCRRMTGMPLHRLDAHQQWCQIEPFDETPDQTYPMIVRHQLVQAERTPFDLAALGTAQPRRAATGALRRYLIGQCTEQHSRFT